MPTIITDGAASAQGYGFAGVKKAASYIEDVFSTYLYTGDSSSTRNISNGIDLAGKGGLTWIKTRTTPPDPPGGFVHFLFASDLGQSGSFYNYLSSNYTGSTNYGGSYPASTYGGLKTFNSDGFTVAKGSDSSYFCNYTGQNYVSWTFRKQAKFFDIVTYTGNGNGGGRYVSHNLGSAPGFIIVKRVSSSGNWTVGHRSTVAAGRLNSTMEFSSTLSAGTAGDQGYPVVSGSNSTQFFVANGGSGIEDVNANGATYVAYLFAHDAGGFGASGSDNVISCGSFTASSGAATVTLGYEPQWVLYKQTDGADNWKITDNMRGMFAPTTNGYLLYPNLSNAEAQAAGAPYATATGFSFDGVNNGPGSTSGTYIYIAIRRGPMKTPTSGTSVFAPDAAGNNASANGMAYDAGFPVDLSISGDKSGVNKFFAIDRLRGGSNYLTTTSTVAEADTPYANKLDNMTGVATQDAFNFTGRCAWMFRRAPGFFDEVCYTGTGSARTLNHNLGVTPELIINKNRSGTDDWYTTTASLTNPDTYVLTLNSSNAQGNTGVNFIYNRTASTFSVFSGLSNSGQNYVNYLFATVAGVSKVGSYTGSGTTKQIDCGFNSGARFVLIKRTDSTGDWYVWDSARGIVAGNDPYLLLNSTAAEVTGTDYVDTYAAGFEISSTAPAAINANGGSFIFLAIA